MRKQKKIFGRRFLSGVLAWSMIAAQFPAGLIVFAEGDADGSSLTDEQLAALEEVAGIHESFSGLIGFEGDYELPDSDELVSIIAVFNTAPAEVQVIEAYVTDGLIGAHSLEAAEANIVDEHQTFTAELHELLDYNPRGRSQTPYVLDWTYRRAFNGVAITVPANQVAEIAEFETVSFVIPNETVSIPEPVALTEDDRDPLGMQHARHTMNAHVLHRLGYLGEGVLVAVLDTGIDYYHPAFAGAFPTLEQMQARNPENPFLGNWAGLTGVGLPGAQVGANPVPAVMPEYDYFFGRNFILGNGWAPWNDPMETSPGHPAGALGTANFNNRVNPAQTTSHGTHVAGTILGRDTGGPMSILGIAPEAQMIAYRVLGPGGSGQAGAVLAGIEMVYYDNPDVVNMSLGGGGASPFVVNNLAVNNIVLSRPHIVFTNSQGNSGPGFSTLSAPAAASLAIGVSSLAAPGRVGLNAQFPVADFERTLGGTTHQVTGSTLLTHVYGNADFGFDWAAGEGSHLIHNLPAFQATEEGDITLVALPTASPRNPAAATVPSATGGQHNIGFGTRADFQLLRELYTPEQLEGAWLVAARQNSGQLARLSTFAYYYGLAGVISLTNEGALNSGGAQQNHMGNGNDWSAHAPNLMVDHLLGLAILDAMPTLEAGANPANSPRETLTFRLTDFYGEEEPLRLSTFSSRGPVLQTFEIKPDIGAQGQGVLSAVPRWTVERPWEMTGSRQPWQGSGNEEYFSMAYQISSGTSMSAPALAGAAALMVQYSLENFGTQWSAEEIKTRMMNNSILLDYNDFSYGIFDKGAGQVDVYAAVKADTVVYGHFPKAVTATQANLAAVGFIPTRTGSFSFGGSLNSFVGGIDGTRVRTLTGEIENQGDTVRTYELSYRFLDSGRLSRSAEYAELTFSQKTLTVYPGESAAFDITMTLAPNHPEGHFEGFIQVTSAGEPVSLLPFAAVGQAIPVLAADFALGAEVLGLEEDDYLSLSFVRNGNLRLERFVFEAGVEPQLLPASFFDDARQGAADLDAFVGYAGTQTFSGNAGLGLNQAVGVNPDNLQFGELTEGGQYLLALRVYRQNPLVATWFNSFEKTIVLPFAVNGPEPVDYERLEAIEQLQVLVAEVLELEADDFTALSWEVLAAALATALLQLEDPAETSVILEAYSNLRLAVEALDVYVVIEDTWSADQIFDTGDYVIFDGRTFIAQWWTRNQEPGNPNGPWMEVGETIYLADGQSAQAWTATMVYDTGDVVYFDGQLWSAQWWSRNQQPGTPNGPWRAQ